MTACKHLHEGSRPSARPAQERYEDSHMNLKLRPGKPEDAAACGLIIFEAFKTIDSQHNFPWSFPSAEFAAELVKMRLSAPGFYAVVAELDGKIVGSNFLDER